MSDSINPIIRIAVERRVTMAMIVLGVIVLGVLSLSRLPLEFMPSFESSNVSVRAPYPSSSPEEVEREITRPLEDALSTLNGVERLTSRASSSQGSVDIEFVEGTDMDLAVVEVRDRLDRARSRLPDDLERLYIRRWQSADMPVLRLNLSSDWSQDRLFEFIEDVVQRRLERLEGVASVTSRGLRSRELQINLMPSRMAAHGIGIRDLVSTIQDNNVTLSAGYIREGSRKLLVRSMGELDTLEKLRELPLNRSGLRLQDVAEIRYDFPRKSSFNFLNADQSISVEVHKASTSNLLQVVDGVKAELEDIQALPEAAGMYVRYYFDASEDVRKGLRELFRTGLLGGTLAVVFMLLFLRRFRMTLLVAFAIPLSLVLTFVIMYLYRIAGFGDISINIMSLMGLMLAVGMLVDNSIVVIESVVRHRQTLGEDPKTSALRGASEVAMPIICSTLTTICVFVPMIFLSGSSRGFGGMMRHMGLTVVIVMVSSLLVSLTIVPTMAAVLLKGRSTREHRYFERIVGLYGELLRFTLHHRLAFTLIVVAMLWGSWRLYQGIDQAFEMPSFQRQITLTVDVPRSYSLEERQALYAELYEIFDSRREQLEIADIAYRYQSGGTGRSRGGNNMEIFLVAEERSRRTTLEIRNEIHDLLPVKAGVSVKIGRSRRGPPGHGGGSLRVELVGDDSEILELVSEQVVAELRLQTFVKDVDTSLESGDEEIIVSVSRERALQSGLSTQAVARSINNALSSRPVSYFKSQEREIGLVVQYREEDRETLDQLRKMSIGTGAASLPIGSLADFEVVPGPRTIERENRRSKLTIEVETVGNTPSFAMMGPMGAILGSIGLPPGYEWNFGRSWFDAQADIANSMFAFAFALVLIYMIMAALFENFLQPLTILFSIPFAFIGVGLILKLAEQQRGNATQMGLIILAGIVVNNAIVLIDHINHLRKEGLNRLDAIIQGGRNRLRPIVMTAATTILGLTPMVAPFFFPEVFGQVEGRAAMWAPIGLIILGGLTTSTFLTLMIIPTIYSLMDDLLRFGKRVARVA